MTVDPFFGSPLPRLFRVSRRRPTRRRSKEPPGSPPALRHGFATGLLVGCFVVARSLDVLVGPVVLVALLHSTGCLFTGFLFGEWLRGRSRRARPAIVASESAIVAPGSPSRRTTIARP